jgi:hypothetical protein
VVKVHAWRSVNDACVNPAAFEQFEQGKEYFIDIQPAQ